VLHGVSELVYKLVGWLVGYLESTERRVKSRYNVMESAICNSCYEL